MPSVIAQIVDVVAAGFTCLLIHSLTIDQRRLLASDVLPQVRAEVAQRGLADARHPVTARGRPPGGVPGKRRAILAAAQLAILDRHRRTTTAEIEPPLVAFAHASCWTSSTPTVQRPTSPDQHLVVGSPRGSRDRLTVADRRSEPGKVSFSLDAQAWISSRMESAACPRSVSRYSY